MDEIRISEDSYDKAMELVGKEFSSMGELVSQGVKESLDKKNPNYTCISHSDTEYLCDWYGDLFGRKFRAEVIMSIETNGKEVKIKHDYFNIRPL
jgi:hypothetical protein